MELRDEIRSIIVDKVADICHVDKSTLSDSTNLKSGLKIKSVEMVGVIGALEEEYELYIDFIKLRRCETIGEIIDFMVALIEG